MSTSESSDSELESDPADFESQYISAAVGQGVLRQELGQRADNVTLCDDNKNENLPEDQLEKFQKTIEDTARNSGTTEVHVHGSQPSIHTGPTIILKGYPNQLLEGIDNPKQLLEGINIPQPVLKNGFEDRLEKMVGGIRDYYHTNLMVFSPLPWVHLRSSLDENFCVELVIKQMSDGGRDVR